MVGTSTVPPPLYGSGGHTNRSPDTFWQWWTMPTRYITVTMPLFGSDRHINRSLPPFGSGGHINHSPLPFGSGEHKPSPRHLLVGTKNVYHNEMPTNLQDLRELKGHTRKKGQL